MPSRRHGLTLAEGRAFIDDPALSLHRSGAAVNRTKEVIGMREIVAWLYLSLDGVVESPEKWASPYFNDEMWKLAGSGMAESDTILLGRRTYQEFAAYWPNQTSDVQFADYLNNTPKLVVSQTLRTVEWQNSSLIKSDVVPELTKLKQRPGKNITILGSATLVRSLLRNGLLDELKLMIFPVVVGAGKRLFKNGADQGALKLVDARTFSTGVLGVTYEPAGQ